jgi:hypothetical protein
MIFGEKFISAKVESAKMEITKGAGPPAKQVSKEFFELLF